tara:strand:- start:2593 stop:2850 length:258 start_codon:yes stop_codon:yes gene_type:complete
LVARRDFRCGKVRGLTIGRLEFACEKIKGLRKLEEMALVAMAAGRSQGDVPDCSILETLRDAQSADRQNGPWGFLVLEDLRHYLH